MPKVTLEVIVANAEGLHARPAMQFVDVANRHGASVIVCKDDESVDGKSVMSMLTLGATQGTSLRIEADGDDAEALLAEIRKLFDEKFGEE